MKFTIADKITLLNQTALESLVASGEREIIKKFTETGLKIFAGDFGCAWYKPKGFREFELAYKSPHMPYVPQKPRKTGINSRLQKTKKPYLSTEVSNAGLLKGDSKQHMKSLAGIPMIYRSNTYGNIILCFKNKKTFSQEELGLAEALGNAAAQAITIYRLYSNLKDFKNTLDATLDSILIFDPQTLRIDYANTGAAWRMGHLSKRSLVTDWVHKSCVKDFEKRLQALKKSKSASTIFETVMVNGLGRRMDVEVLLQHIKQRNHPGRMLAIIRDLSERKKSQAEIKKAVLRDSLTGLPNRILLKEKLEIALKRSKSGRRQFAVVFIDLDQFKFINDVLGHFTGDLLLRRTAQRLENSIKKTDTVFRLGGDEFVILLNDISVSAEVEKVAKRILENFKEPFNLSGHEIFVNISMGISLYPRDGLNADTLLKNSDDALYRAKQRGGSSHEYYFPKSKLAPFDKMELDAELRLAVKNKSFEFYFQPIHDLNNQLKIVEVEALLRWKHGTLGIIPPQNFIKHLEESGMIAQITQWQFEQVCEAVKKFQGAGFNLPVAINFSARQLLQKDVFDKIALTLHKFGVDPKYIKLEITEGLLVKNIEAFQEFLSQLRSLGVATVIDDFGTGYASLSYLKQLPVDCLKIDQSFIQNMLTNNTDLAIVSAILGLGRDLGLRVISEGVESLEQHKALLDLGGMWAQGNWYSRAMDTQKLMALLNKHSSSN